MSYTPYFSETERTPEQRLESVQWAFGVSASAGGAPSPELVQLYERYIFGEIDTQYIDKELNQLYPQYPSNDPYAKYAPGEGPYVTQVADYNGAKKVCSGRKRLGLKYLTPSSPARHDRTDRRNVLLSR